MWRIAGALAVTVALFVSATPAEQLAPATLPAHSTPAAHDIDQVIIVSIDGLRPDAITVLGERGTPNLHRLLREGASTLNARNLIEQTTTLPNHASMLTSQRVTVSAGGMGVSFNYDRGGTIHDVAKRYVPSVFDVVAAGGGSSGLFASKSKFVYFDRSWQHSIDEYVNDAPEVATHELIDRLTSDDPLELSFLHLRQPDASGHGHGWMSRSYLQAVTAMDKLVGKILIAIDASPTLSGHTVLIVTSDHGGEWRDHHDQKRVHNFRVPFLVWGADVAAGADLYALNPSSRVDPVRSRPEYSGAQPIRNGEVGNLATDLLGLPAIPSSLFDADHDLNVFPLP
jgi:hypothetical protein